MKQTQKHTHTLARMHTAENCGLSAYPWRSVQKAHVHIQVNLTCVRIGDHVPNNLYGGTSDQRKWYGYRIVQTGKSWSEPNESRIFPVILEP